MFLELSWHERFWFSNSLTSHTELSWPRSWQLYLATPLRIGNRRYSSTALFQHELKYTKNWIPNLVHDLYCCNR